nr:hypothetical protein [uncultured Haemophilus sp.]
MNTKLKKHNLSFQWIRYSILFPYSFLSFSLPTLAADANHYISVSGSATLANSNYLNDGAKLRSIAIGEYAQALSLEENLFKESIYASNGTGLNSKEHYISGIDSAAIGAYAKTKGAYAVSLGSSANANTYGVAIGHASQAPQDSVAIGGWARSDSQFSLVSGAFSTVVNEYGGIALGSRVEVGRNGVDSDYAISIGHLSNARKIGSISLGYYGKATEYNAMALG